MAVRDPAQARSELKRTVTWRAIADLLAATLGDEPSQKLVRDALSQLGLSGQALDRTEALRVLETLASTPGLAGIAARFAKARIILLFCAPVGGLLQREPAPKPG